MPSSLEARTTRRSASTPRRWPSARGGPAPVSVHDDGHVQGRIGSIRSFGGGGGGVRHRQSQERFRARRTPVLREENASEQRYGALDGEDLFFLGREQLIDLRNRAVGRLLHVGGQPFLI